ncbi:MAG: hypothetical protein WDA16_06890 [Candidatus Thermoplasmatota archaeon]
MRRLRRDNLLDSASRKKILALLTATSGAHVARLAREARLSWTGAVHHLRELEVAGFVESQVIGRRRVYFLPSRADANALALLGGRTCEIVARAIFTLPGSNVREISARTGLSRRVVYYHTLRLREAGLVLAREEPIRLDPAVLLIRLLQVS